MRIKTQFLICIIVFSLTLLIIAASVATTEQQVAQLNAQEAISSNIERGASSLNSISIDYFLYQEDSSFSEWQAALSSLHNDLSSLKLNDAQQQMFAKNVSEDLQGLNNTFDEVVSYLQSASRNVSVRIDPAFQNRWDNMSHQGMALASDASQLSSSLDNQAHQANDTNILLIVSLVGTFGALLATIYLLVFRRTLKSVAELQNGINTIGSGNLEYVIETKRQDEITELSHSFNKMTANLKEVTASKTDLEQAQNSLRASEQRWSTTLASIGDAVIATDLAGKITFMNGVAEELTGWTMSEASLKHVKEIFNIVNEQTRKEVENPVSKVLEKGVIVGLANHTVLIRKDVAEVPIDDSGAPIKDRDGKTTGVVLIFRDISEHKKAEKTLRENEVKFRTVADFTYDWEYWIAPDGSMVYVSPSCKGVTGYEADEFIKDRTLLSKIVHPEDKPIVGPHFDLISSDELHAADFRILTRNGETRWISHSCKAVFDDNGKWIGRRASNRDITERKSTEEALRESEQRLKFHAENIPLAVVEWDSDFVVTRWAGDAEKIFGWKSAETIGKPIMNLRMIYEPDIPIVEKTMVRLTSGETKVVSSNRNITKDGKVIYCTWYNSVLLDENGKMASVFSFVEDCTSKVTAEKALEENNRNLEKLVEERTKQLQDKERLAAIGATAGMVGHDIRNPLQAITGDVYLAKTELAAVPESPEKKNTLESLQEIEKNIDYINKIVADLQDFARPLKPHMEEADLKQIITELLAKNGLPQNVKVSVKVDAEARKVMADCAYINRIMYNLVTNAVQAMPKGGKLTIHAFKDKKTDEAVITVADTGVGIPEAVKGKLFTPMFTTKSKGQGFGLAVIKRMAEALSGSVVFESEEGNGTKFIVRLPQNVKKKTDF